MSHTDAAPSIAPDAVVSWPRWHEPVYGPDSAAQVMHEMMSQPLGPVTLRAFTLRIIKERPDGTIAKLFGIAKHYRWRAFMGDTACNEFDSLVFINETVS